VVPHLTPNRKTSPPYASLVARDAQDKIAGVANGVLLRSTDGAQTFTETDFPLISGDAGLVDRATADARDHCPQRTARCLAGE